MKAKLSRRKFLQSAAVTTTAAMLPGIAGATELPGNDGKAGTSAELPKRRLGRTNRMVSCIGFGSGSRYCNWVADDDTLQKHIDHAIDMGITYFDTARAYGNGKSEERYGKFLTPKYRKQIFLNSKSQARTYDGVMKDIETSLKTLGTDYLDMYTMHGIDQVEDVNTLLGQGGGYRAFLKLRDEGTVRNICFSYHKWNEASQKCFREFDIDVVMCVINAARFNGNEDNLIPEALKRDLGIVAIKIMGQNALIGNVTGDDLLRYALTLPFSVANVGMDGFAPLESCVEVGREPIVSDAEAEKIRIKLNFDPAVTRLPYFAG
jgi:aryl-alcohol dehydrogenase-like predicted oxidoreductase